MNSPSRSPSETWQNTQPPAEFTDKTIASIGTEAVLECPVCQSQDFALYTVGFDYELLTCNNPWRFVQCATCNHVWLNPRPDLDHLSIIYPATYYAYNYAEQINSLAVWGKEILDGFKMRNIIRSLPQAPQTYLDIGCGDGRFLKVMEKRGVARERNYGLELDENSVHTLAAQGYQVKCQRVEDCEDIPENSIDLITIFHVIEHVDNPNLVIQKMSRWLSPNGVLAIETPNLDSLDARLFKDRHWGGYHIPRHWNLFTPLTLTRLLNDNGLAVIATQFQTGHSFWMYSLHHRLRYGRKPWPRLARWFDPLKSLPFLILFTGFDKLRAALGVSTSSMLLLARKPL
jgi:2-polyprenyl-3-methyl-5-hydroxy-6-metoxy-1,4-benzoquinol methylase